MYKLLKFLYDFYNIDVYICLRSLKRIFVDHNICFKKFERNFVVIITSYVHDSILTFNALVFKKHISKKFEKVKI